MSEVRCFLLAPTKLGVRSLRRYRSPSSPRDTADSCEASGLGYHNASAVISRRVRLRVSKDGSYGDQGRKIPRTDPRWPKKCPCGYRFKAKDEWQHCMNMLYRRADNGGLVTLRDAPPGAMWNADWMVSSRKPDQPYVGPDGRSLCVRTPGGDWMTDGPSYPRGGGESQFPAWTRTGEPPNITVQPSISVGDPERYHGFLTAGVLRSV